MHDESGRESLFRDVAHLGIAVKDGQRTAALMCDVLDATLVETVVSEERGLKITFLKIAGTNVELLEPMSGEGPVTRFLDSEGEGFHHIAFEVSDIEEALSKARKAGLRLVEPAPSRGAHGDLVAFIHPSSMNGVLVELCQKQAES